MKLYILAYFILAIAGLIFNTIGEYRHDKKHLNTGFLITILAGAVLGLGFCTIDRGVSSGQFVYKINGVTTSSGVLSAPLMMIIGIVVGLFTNAISTWISRAIAKRIDNKSKNK